MLRVRGVTRAASVRLEYVLPGGIPGPSLVTGQIGRGVRVVTVMNRQMRIVAGKFRGRQLETPKTVDIRPTSDRVREAIFSIIGSRIGPHFEGVQVLDLFAGTGALGFEALSRGAAHCVFIDSGVEARGLIRGHIEAFGVGGQTKLLKRDATDLGPVERIRPAHLVFVDPPYGRSLGEKALASALSGGWFAPDALILVEERKDVDFDPPVGLRSIDRREYADTAITFLERAARG